MVTMCIDIEIVAWGMTLNYAYSLFTHTFKIREPFITNESLPTNIRFDIYTSSAGVQSRHQRVLGEKKKNFRGTIKVIFQVASSVS